MTTTRKPTGGAVITGALSKETHQRLAELAPGRVSKVADAPPTLLVEAKAEDPRDLCARINDVVGSEGVVAPLLVDDDGNRLFPTGQVQVRFKEAPSERRLSAFATRHNVKLAKRNQWAPQQAEFQVRSDDARFLPDITSAMAEDKGVTAAWPDVRAAFRRTRA